MSPENCGVFQLMEEITFRRNLAFYNSQKWGRLLQPPSDSSLVAQILIAEPSLQVLLFAFDDPLNHYQQDCRKEHYWPEGIERNRYSQIQDIP